MTIKTTTSMNSEIPAKNVTIKFDKESNVQEKDNDALRNHPGIKEHEKDTNIVIIGSNFMAATILVASMGFTDCNVTVIDRKDPYSLRNVNQDVYRITERMMPDVTTRNFYNGDVYGDKTNNKTISFVFKDWVNEDLSSYLWNADIVIYAGAIYDSLYAKHNPIDTLHVANRGLYNILSQLEEKIVREKRTLFVMMSSCNVYGDQSHDTTSQEITENTLPNPKDILNYSLYQQENMVKALMSDNDAGFDYLILRLGTLCGDFTPHTSLLTAACIALINKHPTFTVYNPDNSIEILHINDLFFVMTAIIKKYRQVYHDNQNEDGAIAVEKKHEDEYIKIMNQVYNVKADEREEKTVLGIIRSLYTMESFLPAVTAEHKIGKYRNYRIKAPRIVKMTSSHTKKPFIKFGKPISGAKIYENLGFISSETLSYVYRHTLRYVLNHLSNDLSETEKDAIAKILYIIRTPEPGRARREGVKQSVIESVKGHMNRVESVMSEPNKKLEDEEKKDDG